MKKLLLITACCIMLVFCFTSCGFPKRGELVGSPLGKGSYVEKPPYGMVYVPRGVFNIGAGGQDITHSPMHVRAVSVDAFWMDDTEITNSEYRQFVYWVRDSIARTLLGEQIDGFLISEDRKGIPLDRPRINWRKKISWNNQEHYEALGELYYSDNDKLFGGREFDNRKLRYEYSWFDFKQAALRSNAYNYETQSYDGKVFDLNGQEIPIEGRSSFIMRDAVHIYPDTLCWSRDYTYSYNDPWVKKYFSHPGFDNYPVVGVSWKQAKAFCHWRTQLRNEALAQSRAPFIQDYRLPSEAEWEYAARGGLENTTIYPWGSYYIRSPRTKCFLANFKPMRGGYAGDGGLATLEVGMFDPNGYGLYDMAGNVAEWTNSAYDESSYVFMHDFNPTFEYNALPDDPPSMKRKVVRGGSWKDISYFLRVSTRTYEYQDTSKSYIGFRCVMSTFTDLF